MKKLTSANITLRLAEIEDAEFILKLRLSKGEFLSETDNNLNRQIAWLKDYKVREHAKKEYYFIISNKSQKLGTVRVYNIEGDTCTWGSWTIIDNAPLYASIESSLLLYNFIFNVIKLKEAFFDVRKANKKVVNFHQKFFNAEFIKEDDQDVYFKYNNDIFLQMSEKYKSFLS